MTNEEPSGWRPPTATLDLVEGIWQPRSVSKVSYPDDGNDVCLQVEDTSYWFAHRNRSILTVVAAFPPAEPIYDIGGGNGFVSLALQKSGYEVVLVEPGNGARSALRRGVRNVIRSTFEDAAFDTASLPAAAAFDVVEHLENDIGFLETVRRCLIPGCRFYCTIPAMTWLWSAEDVRAGHYRRYTRRTLTAALERAGLEVEFLTHIFGWMVPAIFAFRAVPTILRSGSMPAGSAKRKSQNGHRLPWMLRLPVEVAHARELKSLENRRARAFGSSLLCVAVAR